MKKKKKSKSKIADRERTGDNELFIGRYTSYSRTGDQDSV